MPSAISHPAYTPLKDTIVFSSTKLGSLTLKHRIAQAPLTRMRGVKETDGIYVPGDLAVEYYSQRASDGGFQLTEATDIGLHASGYPGTPGVFSTSQIQGWKRVTDAVHAKNGYIFCQLWHTGRASPPSFRGGKQALSSSAIPITGNALDGTAYADNPPKEATVEEIEELISEFADAARKAVEAGFDGVEIHGANGYLLDQFLHDNVNHRNDEYGGSIENRCRFPLQVIKSVCDAIGPEKVGIRLSPYNYFQDTRDSDPITHWGYLCEQIATLPSQHRPAYVHSIEPRFDEALDEKAKMDALATYASAEGVETDAQRKDKPRYSLDPFRRALQRSGIKFLAAGNFNRENVVPKLDQDGADIIVMGRHFIANPDLPCRLAGGLPLNKYDRNSFYGADPPQRGYTDYPAFSLDSEMAR